MANLPDIQNESNLPSEDDDALDPRVQVGYILSVFFIFYLFNLD
jgi:hypothetical protein